MKQDDKLSVLEAIHARTSIRSYQPQEVEDEKIEQLLRAAMAAPTATNKQPWAFIVIRDSKRIEFYPSLYQNGKGCSTGHRSMWRFK